MTVGVGAAVCCIDGAAGPLASACARWLANGTDCSKRVSTNSPSTGREPGLSGADGATAAGAGAGAVAVARAGAGAGAAALMVGHPSPAVRLARPAVVVEVDDRVSRE